MVEFDKMPAGKALEQKNSTFVIVIQRQIVAKKRAMHFSVNNVSVPALHAPLALISEEKSWLSAALMCDTHRSNIHMNIEFFREKNVKKFGLARLWL